MYMKERELLPGQGWMDGCLGKGEGSWALPVTQPVRCTLKATNDSLCDGHRCGGVQGPGGAL